MLFRSLKISAAIPFAFENPNLNVFSIDLVGPEYSNVVIEGETVTEETTTIDQTTKPATNCNSAIASFFDTTTGLAVLIAVPTILLIIILVLLAVLNKKNKTNTTTPPTDTSTPPSTPTPTSTPAPQA